MTDETVNALLLRDIAASARTIAQLLAVNLPKAFSDRLRAILDSEPKLRAYEVSDGVRSAREVARLAGTSHPTIGRWWDEWQQLGIGEPSTDGRMRAVFDLRLLFLADRIQGAGT